MPRGGRRPGAGRTPLSVAEHLLRGTWRKDRHGPKPVTSGSSALALPSTIEPLPRELVDGLRADARDFVTRAWAEYGDWTPADRVTLRRVGIAMDEIAAFDAAIGPGVVLADGTPHPAVRARERAVRLLTTLLAALELE